MSDYEVVKYSPLFYSEWNEFVLTSKNATFLFHRDFMEYHKDRFEDFTLIIYKKYKIKTEFFEGMMNANYLKFIDILKQMFL